jgi:hypothetical protein
MIIKIIGLSMLALTMFAIGYTCGHIMTGVSAELDYRQFRERLSKAQKMMCDHYCRHGFEAITQDELDDICSGCPLNSI